MADPVGSDKFLLERLNALKPTSITLDPVAKSDPSSTIEKAKPPSKDDALSDRLKSLRNQIDSDPSTSPGSGLHQSHSDAIPSSAPGASATQPQPSGTGGNAQVDHSVSRSPTAGGEREDVDLLLSTNEETLEDLLAELESDQTWLDAVATEQEEKEEEERHRRAIALLEELGGEPFTGNLERGDDNDATTSRKAKRGSPEDHGDDDSDDDSEGDQMARETDDVLEKALDEAELEQNQRSAPETTSVDHTKGTPSSHHPAGPGGGNTFKLPTVPSQLQDQPTTTDDNDDDDDDDNLSETDADFEASIAARMAALKVSSADNPILPSVPASEVDVNELGLPGAPTFSPHDRPVPGLFRKNTGRFTDEDQKSWCIVCLEDGAIRCLGCEDGDNVYCARCWKEMHVGPRAGYEERGHRWEKFVRGLR